jgi:Ca2+-binding RTX toxin-like protein
MAGGFGDDTYIVDNTGDIVTEIAGAGTDRVESSVTYTLSANVENLTLTGAAAINGTGNGLANSLVGNNGDNLLDGAGGADTMAGGLANDTYFVDNVGDVVIEAAGAGTDRVQASITHTLAANVENLTLAGAAAINGTGNGLANSLVGNTANNMLNGGDGADSLNGGGGADSLTGSLAADRFIFQFGQSINSSFDTIMDFEVGIDRIDLLTAGGAALATPTSFSRATNNSTALTLSALASAVFADADGFAAGNQPLGLNAAGLVVSTVAAIAGNYLIINDGTLGYQSLTDLVIKVNLSSGSLPAPGGITASTWFV